MRNLLSIDDLDRDDVERICDRARSFAEVGRREIKKVPTLRGRTIVSLFYESSTRTSSSFELAAKRLSADVVSVKSVGILGGQGRVAARHGRHALGLRAGGDRDPLARGRRRRSSSPAGPTRRSSTPATASTSTRARRCSTSTRCSSGVDSLDGKSRSGSSATSPTAASPAPAIRAFVLMGAEVTVAGPPTLIPRGIEELGCEVAFYARRARARRTWSTRCGCRRSG